MYILGIDTTQAACSAAIFDTEQQALCGHAYEKMQRGHAETLPGIINAGLDQAGLTMAKIGKLATTIGPGTFTGVRVGLSAARGFALALDLPLVGVTSLEAIAAGVDQFRNKRVIAVFDARRDEFYAQLFENGNKVTEPQLLKLDEVAGLAGTGPCQVVGTATDQLVAINPKLENSLAPSLPDAATIAAIAANRQPLEGSLQPLYLRKADAKSQTPLLMTEAIELEMKQIGVEYAEILAQIHQQGFSDSWSPKSFAETLSSPGVICQLAFDKTGHEQPHGFIITRQIAGECEVLTLVVKLEARRRKVAKQLLTSAIDHARASKCEKIYLEVSQDNFAAKNLYDETGFNQLGIRKNYYTGNDGQRHDALIMELAL